ncbi:MAG: ABC transporter substrate-binding protein [gamma proteobacterium symbiont of Bathyaustriella thionipta]|nr:ABC transporter substrate-binding protein [gamma proteobacterium symbiont of Bathyaustriella thionipta]
MKRMMIVMFAALLSSSAWAMPFASAPYPYQQRGMPAQGRMMPATPPRQPLSEAAKTLQQGLSGLTEFLESGQQTNPVVLQAFVETKVAHYFDFDYMAKWVAGAAQRKMDGQQKAALAARFKQEFVSTMIEKLALYDNQAIHLLPSRPSSGDQTIVSAMIMHPGNYPARLDFRM